MLIITEGTDTDVYIIPEHMQMMDLQFTKGEVDIMGTRRVLHVLNNLGSGGAESFIMSLYRSIDKSNVQFDFIVRSKNNGPMIDEIVGMGGKVFYLPEFPKHIVRNYVELDRFFKKNAKNYDAIHVHANALIYIRPLFLAHKYQIPCRIIHSHNTSSPATTIHKLNMGRIDHWVSHRLACSDKAGKWMFGSNSFRIIPNGIDVDLFSFSEVNREEIRAKYSIQEKFVVGHVGRFCYQKNHSFLIDTFDSFHKREPNSVLLLVGDGEERESITRMIKARSLSDSVIFVGAVTDVYKYYSAMDLFVFPSLYEGLGIVFLEAQANGLPCLVSNQIPESVIMNTNTTALSLDLGIEYWAEQFTKVCRISKEENSELIETYKISNVTSVMELIYNGMNI